MTVNDGRETWSRDFYNYETNHVVPLLGFKPDTTNEITVIVYDQSGSAATNSAPLIFITAPLPAGFPPINVVKSQPTKMELGFTLFNDHDFYGGTSYTFILDSSGALVWYSPIWTAVDVRQLENGDLFEISNTNFYERNLLGETVKSWAPPAGYGINTHDGVPTDHGTILYLSDASRVVTNYPTSTTDPNAPRQTANVLYQRAVEISVTNSGLLNAWSLIDMLDPTRIDYLGLAVNSLGI